MKRQSSIKKEPLLKSILDHKTRKFDHKFKSLILKQDGHFDFLPKFFLYHCLK